jgi:Tol biopolymer transport system component
VLFRSVATDLVTNAVNASVNLFLRDVSTGVTRLVGVNRDGTGTGVNSVNDLALNADGRYVAFGASATDLDPLAPSGTDQVYFWDRLAGTNRLVSINVTGTAEGSLWSDHPRITPDGRFVVFESYAYDLVTGDLNGEPDVFLRDMVLGCTVLVSVNANGTDSGAGSSGRASVSTNGQFVAFASQADDLVAGDKNWTGDVFLRDIQARTTVRVSTNDLGVEARSPVISPDGRYVAYMSGGDDAAMARGGGSSPAGLYVYDRIKSSNRLICETSDSSGRLMFSADSRFMAFESNNDQLVANDANGQTDVFVLNLTNGSISLVSVNCDGSGSGHSYSSRPAISGDGRFVAFNSDATDLAPGIHESTGVFLRDRLAGVTRLVSRNLQNTGGANSVAFRPVISDDGGTVAFESSAYDLTDNDANGRGDIFIWALATPSPSLTIARTNNQVQISWPASAGGWMLERTNALRTVSAPWPKVPPPYQTNGGVISVTITNTPAVGNQFFRLHKP